MLVLSRKAGERISIGDSIEVTVVEIRGGRVKLGITAPGTVAVHRGEIADKVRAAQPAPETFTLLPGACDAVVAAR